MFQPLFFSCQDQLNFQKISKISEIVLTSKINYGKIIPINKESRNKHEATSHFRSKILL